MAARASSSTGGASSSARESSALSSVCYVVADPEDDVASIRRKLSELPSGHVALVLHRQSRAFDNPIAMRLLARAAGQNGLTLAIVSRRRWAIYWAAAEGITVFRDVEEIPHDIDPDPPDQSTGLADSLSLAGQTLVNGAHWIVAVAMVFLIAASAFLMVPRAIVTVRPITDALDTSVPLKASVEVSAPNAAKALVPSRMVYLTVSSQGQVTVGGPDHPLDGHAVGFVTFENRTSEKITIPEGTEVSNFGGIPFHTTQQVVLEARPGALTRAPVRADYFGEGSNLKRGEIVVISGKLRWLITCVNEDPISGGGSPGSPIITGFETTRLVDQVTKQAEAEARSRLAAQTFGDEVAIPESINVTPIEQNFDHRVGEVAPELRLQSQYKVSAMIVNQSQLKDLAIQLWRPVLRSGFVLQGSSIKVADPVVTAVDDRSVTFNVPIQAIAYKSINTDRLAQFVRLRRPSDAERALTHEFDLAAPPAIAIVPNWVGRAYRVAVVIDTSAPPTTENAGQSG